MQYTLYYTSYTIQNTLLDNVMYVVATVSMSPHVFRPAL